MDRLPFSAILLLLLGVIALAGFVTGNLQRVWIPMLFGQPLDSGPLAAAAAASGAAAGAVSTSGGDRRTPAGGVA